MVLHSSPRVCSSTNYSWDPKRISIIVCTRKETPGRGSLDKNNLSFWTKKDSLLQETEKERKEVGGWVCPCVHLQLAVEYTTNQNTGKTSYQFFIESSHWTENQKFRHWTNFYGVVWNDPMQGRLHGRMVSALEIGWSRVQFPLWPLAEPGSTPRLHLYIANWSASSQNFNLSSFICCITFSVY